MGRDIETAIRNERMFRQANEQIAARRDDLELIDSKTPFLCECEDEACTAIVRLSVDEYRTVREREHTFVIVSGHPTIGDPTGFAGEGWLCVSKQGKL